MVVSNAFRRWATPTALLLLLLLHPAVAFANNERQQGDMVRCFVALSLAAQDDFLSRQEYVTVVTNLSNNDRVGFGDDSSSFQELPQVLQDNFNTLAEEGDFIDVRGVRQGNGGSTDFVERVCLATRVAIGQARVDSLNPEGEPPDGNSVPMEPEATVAPVISGGESNPESTLSPSVSPAPSTTTESFTPRPTRPLNQCYVGMITSDDDFDKRLNRVEYVSFVQFLKPGSYEGLQFAQLPAPLKDNFDELRRSNNAIDIAGLPRPSDKQAIALQTICDATNDAISEDCCLPSPTVQPTTYPSSSPSMTPSISMQPSNPPKEVVSQFLVSNTVGLSAQQLNMPGNARRRQIDNAYDSLVESVVSETTITSSVNIFGREWHSGNRRQARRLVVDYTGGSTKFYVDSECPAGTVAGAMCQQVVASFFLEISQDENVTNVVERVQGAVSSSIASGDLQTRLADQGSPIMVEEGAPIMNQPSGFPSVAPSMAPSAVPSVEPAARPSRSPAAAPSPSPSAPSNGSRSATGGLSTPTIIGIAAGVAIALSLVLGISVLFCSRRSRPQESKVVPGDEENNQYYGPTDELQVSPSKSHSASLESLPSSTGTGSKQPSLPIRQDSPHASPPYLEC